MKELLAIERVRLPSTNWEPTMHQFFTGNRLRAVFVSATGAVVLLAVYLLHEELLHLVLPNHAQQVPGHAILFTITTVGVLWLALRLYGRVQQRTLEGVQAVLGQAGLGIAMLDRHGRLLWHNPSFSRMFGISGGPWVGRNLIAIVQHVEVSAKQPRWEEEFRRIRAGESFNSELEITRPDGARTTLSYAVSSLRGDRRQFMGTLCVFLDVTESKRMSEELRASRDNLQRLINAIPAGVTVVEATAGKPVLWNQTAERLLGRPAGLDLGTGGPGRYAFPAVRRVLSPEGDEVPPVETPLARTLKTGEPLSQIHHVLELEDGRRLEIAASTAFLETPEGGLGVLIFQDITDIQQLERQLMAEHIQTEKLEALLTTVATLRHEINNPLTGILGAAELVLMQPNLTPSARRYSEKILGLARRIAEQVNALGAATWFERRKEEGYERYLKIERRIE